MTNPATETALPVRVTMYFPQRAYTLIDGINRMALATGGVRNASIAANADYNGHRVDVSRNAYGSFSASYTWAGLCWLARSATFEQALVAAEQEYARGALGAATMVTCYTAEQLETCKARGYVTKEENDALTAQWRDARFDQVNWALDLERKHGVPGTALLAQSTTVAEFNSKVDAFIAERRSSRKTAA